MKMSDNDFEKLLQSEEKHSYNKTIIFKGTQEKAAGRPVFKRHAVIAAALLAVGLIIAGVVTAAKTASHGIPTPPDVAETLPIAPVTEENTETAGMTDTETEPTKSETEVDITDVHTDPAHETTEEDISDTQTEPVEDTTGENITDIETDQDEETTGENITDTQTEPHEDTTGENITDTQTDPEENTAEEDTTDIQTDPEETAEETTETVNHRYNILLYACGEGAAVGAVDGQYKGEKFFGFAETSQKDDMPRKTVEMFGAQHSMSYVSTAYFKIYDHKYDTYMGNNDGLFMFDENTGALVTYSCLSDENAPGYTPPVNAHSSRQDFIDYASALLLEYTGTSTEDCDVSFRTLYLKTTYKYTREEINQEFVNFIDQDPNFSAEYEITFRRKFSEVYRVDDISAIIRSDGTVLNLKCRTSDEKYEPFNDVQIDAESLTNQIKKLSYEPYYYSYNILLTAIPDGNKLWVMADVNYKYDVDGELFGSAVQYITKVAEIPSDQTDPDPVDTEFETWDWYAGTEAE